MRVFSSRFLFLRKMKTQLVTWYHNPIKPFQKTSLQIQSTPSQDLDIKSTERGHFEC